MKAEEEGAGAGATQMLWGPQTRPAAQSESTMQPTLMGAMEADGAALLAGAGAGAGAGAEETGAGADEAGAGAGAAEEAGGGAGADEGGAETSAEAGAEEGMEV